nr:hypothetical protein [Kibdelosporangium sp. MJ126-NF4]CTQ91216.1 hypothetical protein [Kibdelosporangium sp. MJ126-NF4]
MAVADEAVIGGSPLTVCRSLTTHVVDRRWAKSGAPGAVTATVRVSWLPTIGNGGERTHRDRPT